MSTEASAENGATVVITHRVKAGKHAEYENWLARIGAACRASPGHLDWQIIRPIRDLSVSYTVIIRFDTVAHLRAWMESTQRRELISEAAALFATDDEYSIHSGLDFWFVPRGGKMKVPVRWKQFVVTWSAIYPLAMLVPLAIAPVIRGARISEARPLVTLITTGVIVFLMVYVVMPRYTKWVQRWLFA
jgi:hypothetical protein